MIGRAGHVSDGVGRTRPDPPTYPPAGGKGFS
ncbi:MAG: hypothetical protein RLZZ505_2979 [Verrucomicrobiota bacterium]|jgi:hypothetical protein